MKPETALRLTVVSTILLCSVAGCAATHRDKAPLFPGPLPGRASVVANDDIHTLGNDALAMSWSTSGGKLTPVRLVDRINGKSLELEGDLFELHLADGRRIRSSQMRMAGEPRAITLSRNRHSTVLGERDGGKAIVVDLEDAVGDLSARWEAELRHGANYIRQRVTLRPRRTTIAITDLVLMDQPLAGARQVGAVDGSPVVAGNFFFGCEHPMAHNTAGFPKRAAGDWSPGDVTFPDHTHIRWDVTDLVEGSGSYDVLFTYSDGAHRLEIFNVVLTAGQKEVARDDHFGATGTANVDNAYVLSLADYDPEATYTLTAEVRADGGTDSRGVVSIAYRKGLPRVRAALPQNTSVRAGESLSQSFVVGVVPEGQLRRGFLHYVERERAHPYRPFLHYNSWYDIGYFSSFNEEDCLRVVDTYGTELVEKRGVRMDSFLFDDGWDDHGSLWDFHDGLPNGFARVQAAAQRYGAAPGVWLSPWGGYGKPRQERLAAGRSDGYEINDQGFVLSAPRYYARFREICLKMIRDYGVNQFKFDGIGRAGGRYPGSAFGSDFQAAIQLIRDLRDAKPDVYINLTTGTWPSPFWLPPARGRRRSGCGMPTRSGAAAMTTSSPASDRTGRSGSPTAMRRRIRTW